MLSTLSKIRFLILSVLPVLPSSPALAQCSFIFADGFEAAAFEVREAVATSSSEVEVCFNHQVLSATLSPDGGQFLFSGSLIATAAVLSGRNVLVTTTTQLSGFSYSVSVAHSLTDDSGIPLSAVSDSAGFDGFSP
jgi:hypothetical protein